MTLSLDLEHYHWRRDLGEFTLIGTWLLDGKLNRPCMVIIRKGEFTHEATTPCIVPLDDAWLWEPKTGDPKQAMHYTWGYCEALRLDPNNFKNIYRIRSLIDDHLGDLLHIPPYSPPPDRKGNVIAEITVTDHRTGKTIEVERSDDV